MTARTLPLLLALALVGCELPDDPATIAALQGTGLHSAFEDRVVEAEGVVTAVRADGSGFWLQDSEGDGRDDTSDALQVESEREVEPGDVVRVRGRLVESARGGGLPLTRIEDVESLEVLERGQPLPAAVVLESVPDRSIPEAIAYWRPLESMRVRLERGWVVAPTNGFGETAVVADAQRPEGFRLFVRPDADGGVDYNPERILIDDAVIEALDARAGDRVDDLVGVVDYSFGNFKLQPESVGLTRGDAVEPERRRPGGLAVATFNVENLFDGPAEELDPKLDALSRYVDFALRRPAILAVQEVESEVVLTKLAARLERDTGAPYRARSLGSSDGRGIENGLLYDTSQVSLASVRSMSGPRIDDAFGPDSGSPGREPIVGRFRGRGLDGELVVIGNHFKSKRGDDPLFGARQPPRRGTEALRKRQARAVRAGVDALLEADPGALVLVAGDFNDFAFPEPGEGEDHPLGVLEGLGDAVRLENLTLRLPDAYTFLFEGNSQVLDHVLVSPALARLVVGYEIVHGNADRPGGASDHDVPVVRIRLR